jgi:hypothetical protein
MVTGKIHVSGTNIQVFAKCSQLFAYRGYSPESTASTGSARNSWDSPPCDMQQRGKGKMNIVREKIRSTRSTCPQTTKKACDHRKIHGADSITNLSATRLHLSAHRLRILQIADLGLLIADSMSETTRPRGSRPPYPRSCVVLKILFSYNGCADQDESTFGHDTKEIMRKTERET